MNKKISFICALIVSILLLTSCSHEHNLKIVSITEPTCTEPGSIEKKCDSCDYTEIEIIPATGHNYVNGICTICGKKQ